METAPASPRRPRAILIIAAAIGLALAATAVVRPKQTPDVLADDVAAVVNGVPIEQAEYRRALAAVSSDANSPISGTDAEAVLDRLIEQELLVQRALELGFDQRDRTIRNTLITAMVQTIIADADSQTFSDEELRNFYEQNSAYFAPAARVRIRELRVPVTPNTPDETAREMAEAAVARLRLGETFDSVASDIGTPPVAPVPDALLPVAQLRNYLGPTPARIASKLGAGEVSDPVRGGSAYHVIVTVKREASNPPPLESVRDTVVSEMRRRAGDRALRNYIDRLMANAEIQRAAP